MEPIETTLSFEKIGIICKKSIPDEVEKLERVLKVLEKFSDNISLDKHAAAALNTKNARKKSWKKVTYKPAYQRLNYLLPYYY